MGHVVTGLMVGIGQIGMTWRGGRWMDILDTRGSGYGLYTSLCLDRHHGHHQYHPYKRSERRYMSNEFKKEKPPNFDGDSKKPEYAKSWILEIKKLFEFHEYSDNLRP